MSSYIYIFSSSPFASFLLHTVLWSYSKLLYLSRYDIMQCDSLFLAIGHCEGLTSVSWVGRYRFQIIKTLSAALRGFSCALGEGIMLIFHRLPLVYAFLSSRAVPRLLQLRIFHLCSLLFFGIIYFFLLSLTWPEIVCWNETAHATSLREIFRKMFLQNLCRCLPQKYYYIYLCYICFII